MSNPEKRIGKEIEKDKDLSDEEGTHQDSAMREIILGLPSLSISQRIFGESDVDAEEQQAPELDQAVEAVAENQQADLNHEQAVVAAQLVMAAAHEMAMKEKSDGKKKYGRKPRKSKTMSEILGGSGSTSKGLEEKIKHKKKPSSELSHPRGPAICEVCQKDFLSWKGVHGHMKVHSNKSQKKKVTPPPTPVSSPCTSPVAPPAPSPPPLPPRARPAPPAPKFSGVPKGFTIPGPKSAFARPRSKFSGVSRGVMIPGPGSAFVAYSAEGESSAGVSHDGAGSSGRGAQEDEGVRGIEIDLNIDLVMKEDVEEQTGETEANAKLDLNKSPPKDGEEEDQA